MGGLKEAGVEAAKLGTTAAGWVCFEEGMGRLEERWAVAGEVKEVVAGIGTAAVFSLACKWLLYLLRGATPFLSTVILIIHFSCNFRSSTTQSCFSHAAAGSYGWRCNAWAALEPGTFAGARTGPCGRSRSSGRGRTCGGDRRYQGSVGDAIKVELWKSAYTSD